MVQVFIYHSADGPIKAHPIDVQSVGDRETSVISRDLLTRLGLKVNDSNQVIVDWRRPSGKVDRQTCDVEEEPGERFVLGRAARQYLAAETGSDETLVVAKGSKRASAPDVVTQVQAAGTRTAKEREAAEAAQLLAREKAKKANAKVVKSQNKAGA